MPLYIALANMSSRTKIMIKDDPDMMPRVLDEVGDINNRVLGSYAVLGGFDLVAIFEATDNQKAGDLSLEISVKTGMRIMTMPALQLSNLGAENKGSLQDKPESAVAQPPRTSEEEQPEENLTTVRSTNL